MAVAGTRPNYVKLLPLVRAAARVGRRLHWIDAGQHTDHALHEGMLADLGLPAADITLPPPPPAASPPDAFAIRLAEPIRSLAPSVVLVLGDVDASAGAAAAAYPLDVRIAHVEAGLRCGDPSMPEEANREIIDWLSDRFYTTESSAHEHLRREGLDPDTHARLVGNVMADALRLMAPALDAFDPPEGSGDAPYVLATLHRQANVDDPARLAAYVDALEAVATGRRVLFPVHPRTARGLPSAEHLRARGIHGIHVMPPVSYRPFLATLRRATAVVTDSGGIQVEAALLGIPCVIARDRTEHELSLSHGGAVLAGEDPAALPAALDRALGLRGGLPARPEAWDGHAADRIVEDLVRGFPRRARPGRPANA